MEQALQLARKAAKVFLDKGIEEGRLDAELLLAHALKIDRLKLYLQFDRPVTPSELEEFRGYVRRRLKREPVQYIIGVHTFRNLEIKVDRRALIPRGCTELLAEKVLMWTKAQGLGEDARVLDLCTGSAPIALSLAQEGGFKVVATDVSAEALELAAENAEQTGLRDKLDLRLGETWAPLKDGEVFDVIVSNPPYIAPDDRWTLLPEVLMYEPSTALFAQDAGLAILWDIIEGAHRYLRPGGLLALEMGNTHAAAVVSRIESTGRFGAATVSRDYGGFDRMVTAELLK